MESNVNGKPDPNRDELGNWVGAPEDEPGITEHLTDIQREWIQQLRYVQTDMKAAFNAADEEGLAGGGEQFFVIALEALDGCIAAEINYVFLTTRPTVEEEEAE